MEVRIIEHCPACGFNDSYVVYRPNDQARRRFVNLSRIKYQGFMDGWEKRLSLEIHKCNRCGHIWHHTQPDQGALFGMYDASTSLRPATKPSRPSSYMLRQMRALFRIVTRDGIRNPTLLDYGSGAGLGSRAATAVGFTVTAYEPSAKRSAEASSSSEFRVINHLDGIQSEYFDAVNLEQVLEHTQKPIEILKSLQAFCHSHTVLRISVPNVGPLKTRKDIWDDFPFNGKSMHIMSPYEHLQGFSPFSFTTALKMSGLVRKSCWRSLTTHPVYELRHLVGRLLPSVQQTLAIVRFRNE